MPTEFNCQSATRVIIFLFYLRNTLYSLMLAMSACGIGLSIFVMKCMLKLSYLNYLKSLTIQLSTFLRDLLARRNLYTAAASRANGLAAG